MGYVGIVTFLSEPTLKFTNEAIDVTTPEQWNAIKEMLDSDYPTKISVFVDFSLPTGYVAFISMRDVNGTISEIQGGIDADGRVST